MGGYVLTETEKEMLMKAISENDIPLVMKIIEKYGIDVTDDYGQTPLIYAIVFKRVDVVRKLLESGVNPNLCDNKYSIIDQGHFAPTYLNWIRRLGESESGNSPLIYASIMWDYDIFSLLISYGANSSYRDHKGRSADDGYNRFHN